MLPNNEENKIVDTYLNRHSDEFRNLKNEQISIAVNTLNEMSEFRINGSPYLDENMYESFDKINKNEITIEGLELTQTIDKLETNSLNRSAEEFKMSIESEHKIAQNKLNEILLISNPDNDDETIILDDDEETIILIVEKKKLNINGRDSEKFELLKNKQMDIAEKKLMEMYGMMIQRTNSESDPASFTDSIVAEKVKLLDKSDPASFTDPIDTTHYVAEQGLQNESDPASFTDPNNLFQPNNQNLGGQATGEGKFIVLKFTGLEPFAKINQVRIDFSTAQPDNTSLMALYDSNDDLIFDYGLHDAALLPDDGIFKYYDISASNILIPSDGEILVGIYADSTGFGHSHRNDVSGPTLYQNYRTAVLGDISSSPDTIPALESLDYYDFNWGFELE